MNKTQLLYGLAMALGVFAFNWLEIHYAIRLFSTEIYIVVLAILFTGIGVWIGMHFGGAIEAPQFKQNTQVIETLGLTRKELEVLEHLSQGGSNQEIANRLFISISTVKSHLVHLYQKLEVARRTQAIQKARSLNIIP